MCVATKRLLNVAKKTLLASSVLDVFLFIHSVGIIRGRVSLINQRFRMKTADFDLFLYDIKVNCVWLSGYVAAGQMQEWRI